MKNKQKKQLQSFIRTVAQIQSFSPLLLTLIATDNTSVHALQQIQQETKTAHSPEANTLHQLSRKLLSTLETVSNCFDELPFDLDRLQKTAKPQTNKIKVTNLQTKSKNKKYPQNQPDLLRPPENNQNINLINLQQQQPEFTKQESSLQLTREIKELARPEYKKKIDKPKTSIEYNKVKNRQRQFVEQEESNIPIVIKNKNKNKDIKITPEKSGRSVSPKVQTKRKTHKHQLNNISSISKKGQTPSDLSIDIDFNYLNSLPETTDPFPNSKHELNPFQSSKSNSSQSDQSERPQQKKPNKAHVQQRETNKSNEIEEEEPWECDEEEIEQELRQINERLSNRAYRTQKDHIQLESEQLTAQTNRDRHNHPRASELKPKEPKTVRLSLTPTKSKKTPYSKKIQIVSIKQQDNYQDHDSSSELRCGKWKKPNRGKITVDIQQYVYKE